jgi:uncharacterized protein YfdQ (DUF2303 family)
VLQLKPTHEFTAWEASNNKQMDQTDMASFIEERSRDINNPSAATMLEVCRDFKSKTEVEFSSAVNTSNSTIQLAYVEKQANSASKNGMTIPEKLRLYMRVYQGMDSEVMEALFRVRVKEGKLTMWYSILNLPEIKIRAFETVVAGATTGIGRPILMGSPGQ